VGGEGARTLAVVCADCRYLIVNEVAGATVGSHRVDFGAQVQSRAW
jgi:hypothetical protein